MGATSSVLAAEAQKPLDAKDIDTPRGETAKDEVRRLRKLLSEQVQLNDKKTEPPPEEFVEADPNLATNGVDVENHTEPSAPAAEAHVEPTSAATTNADSADAPKPTEQPKNDGDATATESGAALEEQNANQTTSPSSEEANGTVETPAPQEDATPAKENIATSESNAEASAPEDTQTESNAAQNGEIAQAPEASSEPASQGA